MHATSAEKHVLDSELVKNASNQRLTITSHENRKHFDEEGVQRHWYHQNSRYTNLLRIGLLLLSLLAFRLVQLWPRTKSFSAPYQHYSVHFSIPGTIHRAPFGLFVDDNKIWHMYFQSPRTPAVDCGTWGHATSSDLFTWDIEPIAFQDDGLGICGGSLVIDRNNTSGLFPHQTNGVIALYTHRIPETEEIQQETAYSIDGGYSFAKFHGISAFHDSERIKDLRNPKVIWHQPTRRWIMTATHVKGTAVGVYTSMNLLEWNWASEIIIPDQTCAFQGFEMPSLVSIPRINSTGASDRNRPIVPGGTVKYFGDYILVGSTQYCSHQNQGPTTRYYPGTFNGTHFHPINKLSNRLMDFGPDYDGVQFFFGLAEASPIVSLGLATNPCYVTSSCDGGRPSQQTIMTIPREGYLIPGPGEGDLSYLGRPMSLDSLRGETLANLSTPSISDSTIFLKSSKAVVVEARFEMQPPDDQDVELNVDFILSGSKGLGYILCIIIFTTWTADFGCVRRQSRLSEPSLDSLLDRMSARQVRPLLPFHNPAVRRWEIQLIIDGSILEVFLNNGVEAGTLRAIENSVVDTVHIQSSTMPTWASLNVVVQELRPNQSVSSPFRTARQ